MKVTRSQLRKIIKDQLLSEADFSADRMTGGTAASFGKSWSAVSKMPDKELKKSASNLINAFKDGSPDKKTIGQLLDPTGISSIPDIPPAMDEFERKPSLMNGVLLVLSVLAVLPLAGKLAKLGGKTLTRLSKNLKKAEKSLPANSKPVYKKAQKSVDDAIAKSGSKNKSLSTKLTKADALKLTTASRKSIESLKTGSTKIIDEDMYLFIAIDPAGKGKKIGPGGIVKPSKGMGQHAVKKEDSVLKAEKALEAARKRISPDALSRSGNVYLTPYADAGIWKSYAGKQSEVYVAKVPKGSKISYLDGTGASEVNIKVRSGNPKSPYYQETIDDWAEAYWEGTFPWEAGTRGEEIITNGRVKIIGKVSDLLDQKTISNLSQEISH